MNNREAQLTDRTPTAISRYLQAAVPAVAAAALAVATVAGVAGVAGCDKKPADASKDAKPAAAAAAAGAHGVGVVDYDRVFKELGWRDEISKSMQGTNTNLKYSLETFGRDLNNALQEKRQQIGDAAKLNEKQRDDFANGRDLDKLPLTQAHKEDWGRSVNNASYYAQRAEQAAQQISQNRENQLIIAYKDSMLPALRRAAEGAGMSVMVTPAQVVYFNPSTDLTNKVIDDLRAAPPPHNVPDAPPLQLPKIQLSAPPPATGPTTGPTINVPTTRRS